MPEYVYIITDWEMYEDNTIVGVCKTFNSAKANAERVIRETEEVSDDIEWEKRDPNYPSWTTKIDSRNGYTIERYTVGEVIHPHK